jgi:fibronectin-binding autotransporter adhesin
MPNDTIYNDVGTNTFTNAGTVEVTSGTLSIPVLTNVSGAELTGGSYVIGASSALELANNTTITTLDANITLNGAGSELEALDTSTDLQVGLESTLTTIAAGGVLQVLGSRGYTTTNKITNSGTLVINGGTFKSGGTLTVAPTGVLRGAGFVQPAVANLGLLEATGSLTVTGAFTGNGAVQADADAVLTLNEAAITSIGGKVTLNGVGSDIRFGTTTFTTLEQSLTVIASSGTFSVLGGRGFAATHALEDSGILMLAGGTLAAAALSTAVGGVISGSGTLAEAVANAGTIDASGGLLKLAGSVTGTGTLQIANASTLELAAADAEKVIYATGGVGTLQLDSAASFTGAIQGLALNDAIKFTNETITSAVLSGSTLTVTGSGGTTKYSVAGALAGNHFAIQPDKHTLVLTAGTLAALSFLAPSVEAVPPQSVSLVDLLREGSASPDWQLPGTSETSPTARSFGEDQPRMNAGSGVWLAQDAGAPWTAHGSP